MKYSPQTAETVDKKIRLVHKLAQTNNLDPVLLFSLYSAIKHAPVFNDYSLEETRETFYDINHDFYTQQYINKVVKQIAEMLDRQDDFDLDIEYTFDAAIEYDGESLDPKYSVYVSPLEFVFHLTRMCIIEMFDRSDAEEMYEELFRNMLLPYHNLIEGMIEAQNILREI